MSATKYQPGQVAAFLFSAKKKKKTKGSHEQSNDVSPLTKLFSPISKSGHTVSSSNRSFSEDNDDTNVISAKEVKKKKKKRKNTPGKSSPGQNAEAEAPQAKSVESQSKKGVQDSPISKKVSKSKSSPSTKSSGVENENTPPKTSTKKKKKKKALKIDDISDASNEQKLLEVKTATPSHGGGKKSNDAPSAKKRKLDKGQNGEEGSVVKRPRRDRQREKTADNRTIFVGNCPLSADKKTLKQLFQSYGKIESIRFRCAPPADPTLPRRAIVILKQFHEQCNSYVAYIVFVEEESATKALEKNGYKLDNHHLRVDIAGSSKKHDKKRSIFVGNLPFTVDEEQIRNHFEDCGAITNVRIVRDRQTSLGKGISYVQFESKDSVSLALKLNGSDFNGRALRVMVCVSKLKKKDTDPKGGKSDKRRSSGKPGEKKMSFAPSNISSTSFKGILQTKKEKRLRKIKKKKENFKKSDGLSAIFGDQPAAAKPAKGSTKGKTKGISKKGPMMKRKPGQKGSSFKGKGQGFKGKGQGFKGKGGSKAKGKGGKR